MNSVSLRLAINFSLAGTFCSCVQPPNESGAVQQVIYGLIKADNETDLDRVLSYYHSAAILTPSGKSEIKGIVNVRKNYEAIFAVSQPQLEVTIEALNVSTAFAVAYGSTRGKVFMKSDSSVRHVNDRYSMFLEKEKGEWKIKRLMWGPTAGD